MLERIRKRVFRRSLHRNLVTGDSQAVLQKLVQEANGYLLKIAVLEEDLQPHSCDVKEASTEVPKASVDTSDDVKVSLQRLDEAVAFLRQIAGLEEPRSCDVKESPTEVPKVCDVTGDDVKASLRRLDEATAFLRQIADLDEQTGQKVENTEQKDVGTELSDFSKTAAHTEGDDARLWDEFVTERSSRKVDKELQKEKKTKSRVMKIASMLFMRK